MNRVLMVAAALLCAFALLAGCGSAERADSERYALGMAELYAELMPDEPANLSEDEMLAIMDRLSLAHSAVTDAENRLAFENADIIYDFFDRLGKDDSAEVSFARLMHDGGLLIADISCKGESRSIKLTRLSWNGQTPYISYTEEYPLLELKLTDKKFLIYSCDIPNTTESLHGGYIEPSTVLRLTMPEERCAFYARRCIATLGYLSGGLFTADWAAGSFEKLDLNTVFMCLYKLEHGRFITYFENPYERGGQTGIAYVPAAELEPLMESFLPITAEELRAGIEFDDATASYVIDAENAALPNSDSFLPSADVLSYTENADGSISLETDAVFVRYATDRAFHHVLTVKQNPDGGFCYISNRLIPSSGNILPQAFAEDIT